MIKRCPTIDSRFANSLRSKGVLVFDVDDTLLARRGGASVAGEGYRDSTAAQLIPNLIGLGFQIGLVTGHGWAQLERRLIKPLSQVPGLDFNRLWVYANRGATRISSLSGIFEPDHSYSSQYLISPEDAETIGAVINEARIRLPNGEPLRIDLREMAIARIRPVTPENRRRALIANIRDVLHRSRLAGVYETRPAGRTTIEIARRDLSKKVAVQDILGRRSASLEEWVSDVAACSLYIGDEFEKDGNDEMVAIGLPGLRCISVATLHGVSLPENVTPVYLESGLTSTERTAQLIHELINLLD